MTAAPKLSPHSLLIIPISAGLAGVIGKRSQKQFAQMWKSTGELNGHIEEAYSGHALVKTFGRQKEVEQVFATHNDGLFKSSFGAQFISGIIMPVMFFVGNLNYVIVAVIGGLKVAHGQMQLGDVRAFIQYSRMFTQPITQLASMTNLLQSGVASAERVFEVLDAERDLLATAQQRVQTRRALLSSRVALYAALGGGTDTTPHSKNTSAKP